MVLNDGDPVKDQPMVPLRIEREMIIPSVDWVVIPSEVESIGELALTEDESIRMSLFLPLLRV